MEAPESDTSDFDLTDDDTSHNYGSVQYWDERYSKIDKDEYFDWYQPFWKLTDLFEKFCLELHKPKDQIKILMVGCGNAILSAEMHEAGYTNIVNIDISNVLIKEMKNRHPQLVYILGDCTKLDRDEFPDFSYDLLIDKGTLDAILCGGNSLEKAQDSLKESYRILVEGGIYVCITYGLPKDRLGLFQQLQWKIEVQKIESIYQNPDGGPPSNHYIYICRK